MNLRRKSRVMKKVIISALIILLGCVSTMAADLIIQSDTQSYD